MVIEIGTENVEDDGRELVLTGAVKAPVNWNYVIGMKKQCWDDFFSIALSPRMAGYMATPKRLMLFVKLTLFVGVFLLLYPITFLMSLFSRTRSGPCEGKGIDVATGRFMELVAAGRRSSVSSGDEPEEDEEP